MTKFILTLMSGLLLSNIALAQATNHQPDNQSFFNAVLDINAMNNQNNHPKVDTEIRTVNTHESERGNSLFHAVLAIQKVQSNLQFDSSSLVNYSRYTSANEKEKNNSLFRGALSK